MQKFLLPPLCFYFFFLLVWNSREEIPRIIELLIWFQNLAFDSLSSTSVFTTLPPKRKLSFPAAVWQTKISSAFRWDIHYSISNRKGQFIKTHKIILCNSSAIQMYAVRFYEWRELNCYYFWNYFAWMYPFAVRDSAHNTAPPAAPLTVLWDRPINL